MKFNSKLIKTCVATLLLAGAVAKSNAVTYTVDPSATWNVFMNVFDVGGPGYGMGGAAGYQFGNPWGTGDLRASFAGPVLSLKANTIGDPNPYWYTPAGGPGSVGNKIMEANLYAENTGGLLNQTITFSGVVDSYTLVSGYTVKAFIKDFAADFSSSTVVSSVLNSAGTFEISYINGSDAARHLQWGFQMSGPNAWSTDADAKGSVVISAVPEPSIASLLGFGVAGLIATRLRRRS